MPLVRDGVPGRIIIPLASLVRISDRPRQFNSGRSRYVERQFGRRMRVGAKFKVQCFGAELCRVPGSL